MGVRTFLRPAPVDRFGRETFPRWRGRSHQAALTVSIPAGIALILNAQTNLARVAATVYALSLAGLFTSSSIYNRLLGTPKLKPWMRWIDHAMIYALIAGSYTPTCLITLPRRLGLTLLGLVWGGALVGAFTKFVLRHRFRLAGGVLYPVIGCAVVIATPQMLRSDLRLTSILFALGGIAYGIGGLSLWRRSPDPNPAIFGYHEVWHLYVVAGAALHFIANWITIGMAA
jgi:hemolysin III